MLKGIVFASVMASTAALAADPIVGKWKQIDESTGQIRAIVEFSQESNGTLSATIVQRFTRPGMATVCEKCPAPFQNKPIDGLKVITQLLPSPAGDKQYVGGRILDPYLGKVTRLKARLSDNGRTLIGRDFTSNSTLGRTHTWLRMSD